MSNNVKENKKISSFMVMFIIHPVQIGIGVLNFQRMIVHDAGYDAWIAVIFAGMAIHILLWMIYGILNKGDGSLIDIQLNLFGKWLGGFLNTLIILYFLSLTVLTVRSYAEIVQVWMFPELGTWVLILMILVLCYYAINGGFRVVVGVCFFGFLIPFVFVSWVFLFILQNTDFHSLLPIWNHSLPQLFKAVKDMTMTYLGFASLLMAYPFLQKPQASQKWAHISNLFTIFVYLVTTIVSFAFFSEGQLERLIWGTLSMVKIVEMPFLERFEYFFISVWMLAILPNSVFTLWAATRGAKEQFKVKQRHMLIMFSIVILAVSVILNSRFQVNYMIEWISNVGFYFLYAYLPILWMIQIIRSKVWRLS